MEQNSRNIRTYKNLAMNMTAFLVQFFISFYISPIVVENVGTSAYGFIGLANDFVSYATLITTIFNSVASRFIAKAYYESNFERANNYFNSLIITNIILSTGFGLLGIILVENLENVLSVPIEIIYDVKITFALIFGSYILSLITNVFTTATFISNRTDIKGMRDIIQYIIRLICIVLFFNIVSIRVYWVALATLIATGIGAIMNITLTKRLTPELKIDVKYAERKYAIILAKAGCWMAFTSISNILLRGLDLTIANLMIGDYEMGLLSIARSMPNNVTNVIGTLAPIFTPVFLMAYTKGNFGECVAGVKHSIRTMATILFVPISCFIVFSYDFYALWQDSLTDAELITVTVLSSLTILQAYFNSVTAPMAQLSVVANKLKLPVFVSLGCGIVSIVLELFLIKFTNLGIYSIGLSATIVMILRYVLFNPIYAAYCIEQKKPCFNSELIKSWLTIPLIIALMVLVKVFFPVSSWIGLVCNVLLSCIIGYIVIILLLDRSILKKAINLIKKRG